MKEVKCKEVEYHAQCPFAIMWWNQDLNPSLSYSKLHALSIIKILLVHYIKIYLFRLANYCNSVYSIISIEKYDQIFIFGETEGES